MLVVQKLKIFFLLKKVIRILTNSPWNAHCKPLFSELQILTVVNLYIYDLIIYTVKNLESCTVKSSVHSYETRNNFKINVPYCRLEKSNSSHTILGMRLYNKLPQTFIKLPLKMFKTRLYTWLLNNPFYSVHDFLSMEDDIVM